ncbi:ferric reductase NAD binding domain-containing protein [Podospora appendiculata]|uniref:ferric-chelate reductase (NADPH) n=1 Tax=Podospora appendiculata TaxID=314037 RepID=A0AAE0X0G3_9PEZI|nr:ferric reductase NAD binding domain-containing protein [Podospora appendiculata]
MSTHAPASGGTATAGTGNPTAGGGISPMLAFFAARLAATEKSVKYWAAGICGLIGIFIVFHWTRWLCVKLARSWKPAAMLERPFVLIGRYGRNILIRKVPGFSSAGHALLVSAYVAINVACTFTNLDTSSQSNYAARFGWMALVNLVFLVFLALKNTPLAFLTAYSYERLNCLHQIAGYTMFVYMLVHAAMYTQFFVGMGRLQSIYEEPAQIAGIVAGFAFLGVVFSAIFIRRVWYELFYVIHVTCWIMGIVAVGVHRPEVDGHALIITLVAASMWFVDRLIRAARTLYYSSNNEATLYPLPDGATKIVMKKAPFRAEPGKHCFVWIPAVRKFESHPFTIHRTDPVEFLVKAHNGFTSDLHKHALANPGASVTASVDGPYGTFPDPMEYDKIVLIAGGNGATFTFGLAINVLERMTEESRKNVIFIWSVRSHENLTWFKEHLNILKSHTHSPQINVSLYVTKAPSSGNGESSQSNSDNEQSPAISPIEYDGEKSGSNLPQLPPATKQSSQSNDRDVEKEKETESAPRNLTVVNSTANAYAHAIRPGRPDVASLIRDAVKTTPSNQRVLVAACGPDGLMHVVRQTTAQLITSDGPGVELHCEQFGW